MFRSLWRSATSVFRKKNKAVPWLPRHATTCPHNRNAATTATPQRTTPHPSLNPTIIITPPEDEPAEADTGTDATDAAPYVDPLPLPLHESPFINLISLPNNQKTSPLTSTSSVNLTYTNHFRHSGATTAAAAAAAVDDDDDDNDPTLLLASNQYYVYHHGPTSDHQYYHYAYYGTWIPIQDLPDPNKSHPRWIYNAETKTYRIVDHRLFGLKSECDCGVGKLKCGNARVFRAAGFRM